MILGIIGLILLAIGWITEIIKVIKDKRTNIELKFAILYTVGSLLLVIYSIQIGDTVFLILNALITLISMISLYYTIRFPIKA